MAERPDIVLFMVDQMRHDQIGWASGGHFETPNLDRLAGRGCIFENGYSAATTCGPARMALLTGLHPHRHPVQQNRIALHEGFWTLPRALRAAGYQTAAVGKMHLAPVHADHGFDTLRLVEHLGAQGLDLSTEAAQRDQTDDYHVWLEANGYTDSRYRDGELRRDGPGSSRFPYGPDVHPTGWVQREALEVLERRDPSRPLYLVVSFPHPHAPYNPPEPFRSMYDPADSILPPTGFEVNEGFPAHFTERFAEQGRGIKRVDPNDPEPLKRWLATIRGLVKHIDDAAGAVLDRLDLDRTLVWFTSDHGDYSGHRGLLRKKPWLPMEDLARVPLCAAGLDIAAGHRTSQLAQSFDFVRTSLDFAGLEPPAALDMDSRSLRPLLVDGVTDPDRPVFCSAFGWNMVRRGSCKLVRWEAWNTQLLFDLDDDPIESIDRATDPAYAADLADLLELNRANLDRPVLPVDAAPV